MEVQLTLLHTPSPRYRRETITNDETNYYACEPLVSMREQKVLQMTLMTCGHAWQGKIHNYNLYMLLNYGFTLCNPLPQISPGSHNSSKYFLPSSLFVPA